MIGLSRILLTAGLALATFVANTPAAGPATTSKPKAADSTIDKPLQIPAAFTKSAPQSVEDLKAIQDHVRKIVKMVTPAVVGIRLGASAGSGVIIDAEGHVLTAGHVSGKPGRECILVLPNGKQLKGKTLGQNVGIDSGLIKITSKGQFPFVKMGDAEKLKLSQWVLSIGHPGGYKRTRPPVVRLGRVRFINKSLIRTDCTLVGGDSGGPLFDMTGKVIGIHSRIGLSIVENVHVPINTYRETWDKLAKGESWGGFDMPFFNRRTNNAYLGVILGEGDELKIEEVNDDTPAKKAGLQVGDLILGMDDTKLKDRTDLMQFLQRKRPNDEITVLVNRGGAEKKIKVKLGRRPAN